MLILILPDDGNRLFSLSEGHGASALDAAGIVLILVGWAAFLVPLFRGRRFIEPPWLLAALALVGLVLLVWSVSTDTGYWWVLGAAILLAVQLAAATSVIRNQ